MNHHQVERDRFMERERFMATMGAEGMPSEISRRILRHAQTIQRCAELECSSEAADRDRVRCPAVFGRPTFGHMPVPDCLCHPDYSVRLDGDGNTFEHGAVPRYMVTSARAERLIREWCAKASGGHRVGQINVEEGRAAFVPIFSGDPRGACVKIKVPSGRNDSWGGEGAICVPTR